jgi:hypothetical protein
MGPIFAVAAKAKKNYFGFFLSVLKKIEARNPFECCSNVRPLLNIKH